MIKRDFSRTFLRESYDMSEVLSFLADVENTITGQQKDPDRIVTAQQAEDIKFSVRLRGFNVDEVDEEIDRLISVLRNLDRDRQWDAERAQADKAADGTGGTAPALPSTASSPEPSRATPWAPPVMPHGASAAADVAVGPSEMGQADQASRVSAQDPILGGFAAPVETQDFLSAPPIVIPDARPIDVPGDDADFGTQEAVDKILRSMTQSKEQ